MLKSRLLDAETGVVEGIADAVVVVDVVVVEGLKELALKLVTGAGSSI